MNKVRLLVSIFVTVLVMNSTVFGATSTTNKTSKELTFSKPQVLNVPENYTNGEIVAANSTEVLLKYLNGFGLLHFKNLELDALSHNSVPTDNGTGALSPDGRFVFFTDGNEIKESVDGMTPLTIAKVPEGQNCVTMKYSSSGSLYYTTTDFYQDRYSTYSVLEPSFQKKYDPYVWSLRFPNETTQYVDTNEKRAYFYNSVKHTIDTTTTGVTNAVPVSKITVPDIDNVTAFVVDGKGDWAMSYISKPDSKHNQYYNLAINNTVLKGYGVRSEMQFYDNNNIVLLVGTHLWIRNLSTRQNQMIATNVNSFSVGGTSIFYKGYDDKYYMVHKSN